MAAAVAAAGNGRALVQQPGRAKGFDHVALPMQHTDAMLAFYRGLGFAVVENPTACSVYVGEQMINFHRPSRWQDQSFTLRAPAALDGMLQRAGAKVEEGPVQRQGGRNRPGSSVYVRDPDGNLLEFMIYS